MAEIAVAVSLFLLENLPLFLEQEAILRQNVNAGFEHIKSWLYTMQAFLKDAEGREGSQMEKDQIEKDRIKQVRDLAYDIEDAIDEFMICAPIHDHHHKLTRMLHDSRHFIPYRLALSDMSSKIETIKSKTNNFLNLSELRASPMKISLETSSSSSSITDHMVTLVTTSIIDEENDILGFDEPRKEIIDKLVDATRSGRKVLAMVGSGGSGKSVLAKMVYNDRRIQSTFDCHAWVHVGRSFRKEDLVLRILMQFRMVRARRVSKEEIDIQNLTHNIELKKYLVVLDDIWKKEDWEGIVGALPRGCAGSAFIVITRSLHVVHFSHVESPYYIHSMNELPSEVALQLFYNKAFSANNGKCPRELEDVSSQIVQRCEGIPLAIVAIGSLLSKKQGLPSEWKTLNDSLGSEIGDNSSLSIITKTFLPSYNDLPSHLKSCFLYMGIFPEVKRGRLIRSWIAEGFVKKITGKTLEEVAEDYLNELIGRRMIQTISLDFDGRLRSCRAANLVREFIIKKAEENTFLALFPGSTTSRGYRRICVLNGQTIDMSQNMDLNRVRTLFTFTSDISYLPKLDNFTLLKVLDMQDSGLQDFPDEIVDLCLLRYLSLRSTNISSVPKSIKRLSYLETLDLKDTEVTKLPKAIFQLKKLRHLLVYRSGSVEFNNERGVEVYSGIGNLPVIQKLSLIKASYSSRLFKQERSIIEELGNLVHIRKLGLIDLKTEDGTKLCSSIEKMTSLSTLDVSSRTKEEYLDLNDMHASPPKHLQRLYLKGRLSTLPAWIHSLHSLVRIGLICSRLENSPLDTLQDLPNLIELQMVDAFVGKELTFLDAKFKKLKILLIKSFEHLHTIAVHKGALSSLKNLSIQDCHNLNMLPLGISYVQQLKELTLYDMPEDLIAQLESQDRHLVDHIPVIHTFTRIGQTSCWLSLNHS